MQMQFDDCQGHRLRPALDALSIAYIEQGVGCSDEDWPSLKEAFRLTATEWALVRELRGVQKAMEDLITLEEV